MRRKGLEVRSIKRQNATAIEAARPARWLSASAAVAAEGGYGGAEQGEDQHPEDYRASWFPTPGDAIEQRFIECELRHAGDGEVRR
jgi:hypothetical protein